MAKGARPNEPRFPVDPATDAARPVPADQRAGHHPRVEQDKPVGPPPTPHAWPDGTRTYPFDFERRLTPASFLVGVTPWTSALTVTDDDLDIRFGAWHLRTSLANVAGTELTGPYTWYKVAGPAHISFQDRGVTFATSTRAGVCIRFHDPVPALDPLGKILHPAATCTVTDAEKAASLIDNRASIAAQADR